MKLKCLFVLLMIGLMASAGFGAANVCWWDGSNNNWDSSTDGVSNWTDEFGNTIPEPEGKKEIWAFGGTDPAYPLGGTITLDTTEGWVNVYSNRVTISGGVTLNITSTGQLTGPGWLRIGSKEAAGACVVNQTGGLLRLKSGGKDHTRLVMGDSQDAEGITSGTYVMSGGTLMHTIGDIATSEGSIVVGDRGGTGTFKVIGTAPVINMARLYVGGNIDAGATRQATGTLEFDLKAGGVSPIVLSTANTGDNTVVKAVIDPFDAASTANLVVTLADAITPTADVIVLVDNRGTDAISGIFDTVNGIAGGAEGTAVVVGTRTYYLTYTYNATTMERGTGNDLALVPEPATLALLSLGLFAIRRKK